MQKDTAPIFLRSIFLPYQDFIVFGLCKIECGKWLAPNEALMVDANRRLGRNSPTVDYQMRSYVDQSHLLEDNWLDDVSHYGIAVPGDWGFIRNPSYVSGVSGNGDGGHNFIYVG